MMIKFGLEKCANICLKGGEVNRKQYMGITVEIEIKELDSMEAYKY
jgi:hypothetical protein